MSRFITIRVILVSVLLGGPAVSGQAVEVPLPLLFDMGTASSSTARDAVPVLSDTAYDSQTGYGWTSQDQTGFDRDKPLPELRHGGNPMRPDLLYRRHASPLVRDGVASADEMVFRVDLPPGKYRVQVWLGDLHQPLESMAIACNGVARAMDISAKHIIGRGQPESTGLYQMIRFDTDSRNGRIELTFYGDETQYRRERDRYDSWFPDNTRVDSYLGSPWDASRKLKFDPGTPFVSNSVLAVRVSKYQPSLLAWRDGRLVASDREISPQLTAVLDAFNNQRWQTVDELLQRVANRQLKVEGYLALVGHPAVGSALEESFLRKARQSLEDQSPATDGRLVEARESLGLFSRGRLRFHKRGHAEEGHFQENRKVVSIMRLIRPGDLLYFKALQYQGRALQMLDPHRWVYPSGDAQAVWRELIKNFPDDRYARFFLTDSWSPDDVWHHGDHHKRSPTAPPWAVAQREAWGLLLDMCEWWADNKQHPDGSIGGGWGDDVELVALFGLMGSISEGASPRSIKLAEDLIEGLWKYGGIDQEAGYYRGLLDAEHSAEWTGDTLPLMTSIQWGNPLWVERSMQTARLMRDLWMDENDRGDYHFRSNFLGSVAIGNRAQANDSYINYRAALPAVAVYRFNRHPEVARLFVRWADGWHAAAMRTDRQKPRGVFPAEVAFPSGQLGGVDSPHWHTSAHPTGTINYDWQRGSYYGYLIDLMLLAFEITGDQKYVEAFVLQKQLVDRYRANPVAQPQPGTDLWAGKLLAEGTPRGRPPFDQLWPRIERAMTRAPDRLPPVLVDQQQVLERMNQSRQQARRRWPVLTTETSATDRVGFRGIPDVYFIMTGTRDTSPSVTYSGVGRDFAAFVKRSGPRHLTVVMHSFHEEAVSASFVPWKLAPGAVYRARVGVDTNGDDRSDGGVEESRFVLDQRGCNFRFSLAPNATTVVELNQVDSGAVADRFPDLAVVAQEIKYSIWTRDLQVVVHNIGVAAAAKVPIMILEKTAAGTRQIGSVSLPYLPWSSNLQPQKTMVTIPYVPAKSATEITVVVDRDERITEICETNNQATRAFQFDLAEIQAPRERLGEIGGDLSGEIRRGIR